eukprot:789805-Pyramimonas_sp.AAC.1
MSRVGVSVPLRSHPPNLRLIHIPPVGGHARLQSYAGFASDVRGSHVGFTADLTSEHRREKVDPYLAER